MTMTQYKLQRGMGNEISSVTIIGQNISIPFDPANTDYQTFKTKINADEAQLEDADGNLMTAEEAKRFIKTLP
jgi:hypothetical protein